MNKKILIGIIAVVLVVAIGVVAVLLISGKEDKKEEKEEETTSAIMVDGEYASMSKTARNERTKTCLANQREIVSQFTSASMSGTIEFHDGDVYELRTSPDGRGCKWVCVNATVDQSEELYEFFREQPHCPIGGNVIRVTITQQGGYDEFSISVQTECIGEEESHNS